MTGDMVSIDTGRMHGKSEILWAIVGQMMEIDPKWACSDVLSTLCGRMEEYLSNTDRWTLRRLSTEFRDMIARMPDEVKECTN